MSNTIENLKDTFDGVDKLGSIMTRFVNEYQITISKIFILQLHTSNTNVVVPIGYI